MRRGLLQGSAFSVSSTGARPIQDSTKRPPRVNRQIRISPVRVIGADGSLTGFAFGENVKRQLLQHEGAIE